MSDVECLRAIAPEGPAIIAGAVTVIEEGMANTRLNQLHGYWDPSNYPQPNTPSLHVIEQPVYGTRKKIIQAGLELPDVASISPALFLELLPIKDLMITASYLTSDLERPWQTVRPKAPE